MENITFEALVNEATKPKKLYHFTTFEGLKAILKYNSFRLTKLGLLNDPAEEQRIDDFLQEKIFSFSFCHEIDDNIDYFWNNYAKKEELGVCIVLKNFESECINNVYLNPECTNSIECSSSETNLSHITYDRDLDWKVYNITKASVYYVESLDDYEKRNTIIFENDDKQALFPGLIKQAKGKNTNGVEQIWKNEKEQRLRIAIRPKGKENIYDKKTNKIYVVKPKIKYLYIHIPSKIEKIIINPLITDDDRKKIVEYVNNIDNKIEVK